MKRTLFFTAVFAAAGLLAGPSWAGRGSQCAPEETTLIESEAHCFSGAGMDIGFYGDEGVKVACMQNKRVQSQCGPDGRITRLHAYSDWFNKLKTFESACSREGGVFSYSDPNFVEPQDETFCLQAQPEVGTNMFENQLCNYRSLCPAVQVVCSHPCGNDRAELSDTELTAQSAHATLAPVLPVR